MLPYQRLHRRRISRLAGRFVGLAVAMVLAGCSHTGSPGHGLRSRDIQFAQLPFHAVGINLEKARLTLHWRNPRTQRPFNSIATLKQWGERHGRTLLFAANAGIYDSQRAPLGLYVENGKALVPLNTAHGDPDKGNFSLLPNGVFAIDADGHATIHTTHAFKQAHADPQWATQSGPMLVIDGRINPHFEKHSNSVKWRSGVCARTPTRVVFVVSEAPVNFYTFARLFRDKLHCRDALYLDGTLSQIYVDGAYYGPPSFLVKPYAGMFAVFARDHGKDQP